MIKRTRLLYRFSGNAPELSVMLNIAQWLQPFHNSRLVLLSAPVGHQGHLLCSEMSWDAIKWRWCGHRSVWYCGLDRSFSTQAPGSLTAAGDCVCLLPPQLNYKSPFHGCQTTGLWKKWRVRPRRLASRAGNIPLNSQHAREPFTTPLRS